MRREAVTLGHAMVQAGTTMVLVMVLAMVAETYVSITKLSR